MNRTRLFLLITLAATCLALPANAQTALFAPAPGSPVEVGEGSGLVVIADVNRDGKADLIAQHLMQRVVTIQLGDGKGRFASAPGNPLKLSYQPGGIKLGDVNGDNIPDLAVTSGERDAVDIFFGDGSGKFFQASGSPFAVSTSNQFNTGLHLADINEDGKLDVIALSNQRNSFGVLLGSGRGSFVSSPETSFTVGQGRYAFAFGDLDGDGHLDAVVANSGNGDFPEPGNVAVLRGDGKGAFKQLYDTSVKTGTRWITVGDLNGDGRLDLVLNHNGGQLSTLLNQGGGKFTPGSGYDLNTDAFAVAIVDVNQDKQNDLVVATVNSVTVLLNGKTGFVPAPGSPFTAGPGAYHLAVGDINSDGKPDIVASSFEGKTVTVLLGR